MKLSDWEDRAESHPERTALRFIVTVIFLLSVAGGIIGIISFVTYPAQQAASVVRKTLDADNAIYNYEWFHRQYEDLGAMTPKLQNAEAALEAFEASAGPRSSWQFDDRQEYSRLSSIVLGLRNQRASLVADYNAHAGMSNRAIFIGSALPTHVD